MLGMLRKKIIFVNMRKNLNLFFSNGRKSLGGGGGGRLKTLADMSAKTVSIFLVRLPLIHPPLKNFFLADKGFAPAPLTDISTKNVIFFTALLRGFVYKMKPEGKFML